MDFILYEIIKSEYIYMTIPFWANEPTILFNKNYILELWPTSDMCYERKLNAITRIILLITILGFIFTNSYRIIVE